MARIRSVKPDLRTDATVASWPMEVRYAWVLLWGYLDDSGRGLDIPKSIAGDCFPHDDDVTPKVMDSWLDIMAGRNRLVAHEPSERNQLVAHKPEDDTAIPADARLPNAATGVNARGRGPLCRYEVDGIRYLHSVRWSRHSKVQRPTPSKIPPCPFHESSGVTHEPPRSNSGATQEGLWNSHGPDATRVTEMDVGDGDGDGDEERGSSSSPIAKTASGSSDPPERSDVEDLCQHLADRIEANGSKRPTITKAWRDAARLMLDRDGRTAERVHRCIDWCQDDEFWRTNVLSMPKLRAKYDQLRLAAERNGGARASPRRSSTTDERVSQAIDAGREVQAEFDRGGRK